MDTARKIEVIETTLLRRGAGVEGDPVRIIKQYWSLEGELLAEVDEFAKTHKLKPDVSDDTRRLNFLADAIKASPAGISFDWVPKGTMANGRHGFRYMRSKYVGEPTLSLRTAIDVVMEMADECRQKT